VVFIETGAVANGKIGWFPLGPGEAYAPPYAVSQAYLKKVNIAHAQIGVHGTVDASKIRYAHRDVPRSCTLIPRQSFSQVPDKKLPPVLENMK
jgi:hypothetical protein